MKNKMTGKYLLVLLAMCGMGGASVGLMTNVAGLFFTPVSEAFNISRASVSFTLTIANLAFALIGLIVPKLVNENNLKQVIIAAAAVEAGCTILLSISPNIIVMYIFNLLRGMAAGILGFVLITMVVNNWFKANVALVTSIALGFSGLVAAIFSPIVSSVIAAAGWRLGYVFVGIMMVVFNLPAIFFLPAIDPHYKGELAYGETQIVEPRKVTDDMDEMPGKKIYMPLFVLACIYAVFICCGTAMPQHFPGVAESYNVATIGALLLSVGMIANTGGKLICGILIDRIGTFKSVLIYLGLIMTGTLMFLLFHTGTMLLLGALLFGMVYSLGSVGLVMMSKDLFGIENYSRTYPTISMFGTLANAIFSTLVGFFYDISGGYTSTLVLLLVLMIISFVIVVGSYTIRARQLAK
ncbi:MAG: MFS transporter [Erysipelotrichaceae bacterium]|nr:MFS transporter [Erysipelotrichaceae bacterium]